MNAPTLIVGLGGTGSKVALKVATQVNDQTSDDLKNRIAFAVFDTDVNELREIKKENPFVHTIQTSTKLSVGEYLDIDTHARDTWFPVNAILNSKTLTEGAGQVRAVSRMAFETALRAGKMEELHKAIESLYKLEGEEYQQALRVIIVSSLAGGTGSGLILPVALYIKNYLATRFRQSANITRGFFLLPEVFYNVIQGQAERNNLKSNAYATLREIDAFMMKGDATLPEQFSKSVRMEFPNVSSDEFEEYNVRPYDFCFLFDAQNADGKKLNSFGDYLDHAANCIYAQSIGPMNKRSNSSEDNTIRKLVSERGRNRYAGAGTSMLIYPTKVVKRYMALNWAKECVSDIWLMFDKTFRDLLRQNAELRRKGIHVADIKESTNYIASVEAEASNKNPFAMSIMDSCCVYDENNVTVTGYKWEEYMDALQRKISQENNSSSAVELDGQHDEALNRIDDITAGSSDEDWDKYVDAYRALQSYRGVTAKRTAETSRTVAYSIFRSDGDDVTVRKEKYQLETYMRTSTGDFIHPCAVRYYLYKVQESMATAYRDTQMRVAKEEEYFEKFEEVNFDEGDTAERETVNDLSKTKKVTLMDKIRRRYSADQEDLINNYREYLEKVDKYRNDAVYLAVLEEGLSYVKGLCEAFESFFRSFDSKVSNMDKEIRNIENKYRQTVGNAARYVCASKECLQKMNEKMPYSGGALEIDSSLAEAIYLRVRRFSMLSMKSDNEDYFSAIFDDDIINYFSRKLMESYGSDIDVDVISAIEKEAEYEHEIVDTARVTEYVKSVISSSKVLAAPFIEKPIGEEKDPINSCAFNDELSPGDDSPRAQLLGEQLFDFGGVADPDIPKNMILFYKSFYGLRANDLSKFAPPQNGETYERSGGEYFKAYYELVSKIHPIPSKSKVITPHIDRWWHNVKMMPDLDEDNQERQLNDIYAAFFWALLCKKIGFYPISPNQSAYRLIDDHLLAKDEDKTLTVSNGTPCDQIYEVLDAMAVYPELVLAILRSVNNMMEREIEAGKKVFDNELYENMTSFTIDQMGDENSQVIRSIFEIPFILKKSMTPEVYNEKDTLRIMEIVITETCRLIRNFSSESDYPNNVSKLFVEQFDLLISNLKKGDDSSNVFGDFLFDELCEKLIFTLKEMGTETFREIKKKSDSVKKGNK